jgi:hypothetical protein
LDQEKKTLVYIGLSTGYYDNNTIKVLDYTPGNHKNTARVQNKNKTFNVPLWQITSRIKFNK